MSKVLTKRHIAKTISYRVVGTITTMIIAYAVTGQVNIAVGFGVVEVCLKMLLYFLHERIWYKFIKYGVVKNGSKSNSK
jgi:uncharacterized membrane protein